MANIGSLAQILAASTFIFLVTIEKGIVLGCSGGGSSDVSCKYGDFPCDDGKKCYTEKEKCDGTKHCADNSDEDNHHCGKFMMSIRKEYCTKYFNVFYLYEDKYRILNICMKMSSH
jgi:hypothetical protein